MIPTMVNTEPPSRIVERTVRYITRLPPDSPEVRQWEKQLGDKMVDSDHIPMRPRHPSHSQYTDILFRTRFFTAVECALGYSANESPPTPFPIEQIQMLHSAFAKLESAFGPEHTDLCEKLAGLMNNGHWAEVIFTISTSLPQSGSTHVANRKRAVQNSVPYWTDTYGGDALNGLIETLRAAEKDFHTKSYYSKTIDIIQSSGCGKSRMVAESGNLMIQISFPLRFDQETGFPPGDPEVFWFLNGGRVDYQNTHSRAMAFLAAFVSSFQRWYQKHFQYSPGLQLGDVLDRWNAEINTARKGSLNGLSDFRPDSRSKFCRDLVQDAEGYLVKILKDFAARGHSGVWDWEENFAYEQNPLFREILLAPLARLLEALPRPQDDLLPRILLGIDEAGNLLKENLGESLQNLRVTAIRRVFRSLSAYRIWAVFLSTNGRMEIFTTSKASDPSSRVESGQLIRITPYVSLELHVEERRRRMANPSEKLKPMSEYTTVEHTTGYGRPLWRLYSTKSYAELSEFVLTKLLGGGNILYTPTNKNHAFAAVSSRVTLSPSENRESVQLAWAAIHYHLGLLVSVNMKNGMLLTTTASEPVVSDAVSKLLMGLPPDGPGTEIYWISTLKTLAIDLLNMGMVGRGTRGELYCQIMPIIARDLLLFEKTNSRSRPDFFMSSVFPYKEFLDTLLGRDVVSNAYACHIEIPLADFHNRTGPTQLIDEGYCNFNHFVFTSQELKPETFTELLLDLLRSNAALQLTHRQENWDQLIPVYFGDPKASMDPSNIGALFIQAKNRIEDESMRLSPSDYAKYLPAGALVVHLQIEAGVERFKERSIRAPMPVFTPKKNKTMRKATQPFVLGIQVYGHHIENFPFLNKREGLFEVTKAIIDGIKIPRLGIAGGVRERLWGHHPLGYFSAAATSTVSGDSDVEMTQPGDE